MVRLSLVSLPFLGLLLSAGDALAVEWWHDPERGCGIFENWKKTSRIADLPGCDGELPKGAPAGEVAMHDAKKLLRELEKQLDAGQQLDVEGKINQATEILNKAPIDPRVNWARVQFNTAFNILKSKSALVSKVPKLRTAYKALADAAAAQPKPDAKAVASAADACIAAFREAESQGVNLSIPFELTPGKARPLREDLQECEATKTRAGSGELVASTSKPASDPGAGTKPDTAPAKPDATPAAPAKPEAKGGSDGGVPRPKWVKKLKGDRKKVFEDHADAFPEFDGEPGPKGAAKAAEWKYGGETFKFKGNKLLK